MGKRFFLYSFLILVILTVGGYLGVRFFSIRETPVSGAIELVPDNAVMILKTENFKDFYEQLTQKNNFWKDLDSIPAFAEIKNNLTKIIKPIQDNNRFQEVLTSMPVIISLHLSGKKDYSLIFYMEQPVGITAKKINEFLKKEYFQNAAYKERIYDGKKIVSIKQKGQSYLYYTFVRNVLVVSRSSLLVELVIRQSKTKINLLSDKQFLHVNKTAGKNVLANLFINLKYFPKLATVFLKEDYYGNLKDLNIGDWCEMDLSVKKSLIMMNGFMNSNDSIFRYINLFKRQSPVNNEIKEVLPFGTIAFINLGISDIEKFQQDFDKFKIDEGISVSSQRELKAIKNKYGFDIQKIFYSIFDDEVALAFEQSQHDNIFDDTFVVYKTASQRLAREELLKLLQTHAKFHGNDIDNYIFSYHLDDEKVYSIYYMPFPKIFKNLFGNIFEGFSGNYVTFIDNYMIFSPTKKGLSKFILDNVRQQTLDKDLIYMDFKENLSNKSNLYFFTSFISVHPLFSYYFNSSLAESFEKNKSSFNKIYALGFQISGDGDLLYNSISIYYNSDIKEKPHTIWETHLDTAIFFKPKLVVNHRTMQKEIFLQDLRNNIYLINASGRILWKIHLDEQIKGDVYQVDKYKNNKLQYLFNTKTKIYLIDRNGNNVEHFPVNLRSPATNGLAVFDYDKTRDYRIFVAGEDKHIYLYDIMGNILPGWHFDNTDNFVVKPVQHFRLETKDFIVFADSLKTYILNRKGENRVSVSKYFPKSKNAPFYLYNPYGKIEGNYLVTTNRTGKLYFIGFDGTVKVKEIKDFTPEHYFVLEDINRDGHPDFLFLDKNMLSAYNSNKKEIFSYTFNNVISSPPIIFTFPNNVCKIGIIDKTDELVYLFNADGSLYNNFPLEGKSSFSIGHFDSALLRFNLLVGGKGNFLYNYAVN